MAEYGEEPSYMDVFIRYYRDLVRGLPASRMREDFIHRGLLGDVSLLADIDAERTDQAKIRILLESIRKGVSICVNNSFLKFLEAVCKITVQKVITTRIKMTPDALVADVTAMPG